MDEMLSYERKRVTINILNGWKVMAGKNYCYDFPLKAVQEFLLPS